MNESHQFVHINTETYIECLNFQHSRYTLQKTSDNNNNKKFVK